MKRLSAQVFCPECGAMRVCQPGSRYAVCPSGHGRLVPRFTKAQAQDSFVASLPRARRVARNLFRIQGHPGLFCYLNGSGRRRATPGTGVEADEVVARRVTRSRQLIRVFTRKFKPAAREGDVAR